MNVLERLDRLPLSRPHRKLLVIGGLGYTFDGMDAAVVAFLLPAAKQTWHLSNAQLGIIGSATPFGFLGVLNLLDSEGSYTAVSVTATLRHAPTAVPALRSSVSVQEEARP